MIKIEKANTSTRNEVSFRSDKCFISFSGSTTSNGHAALNVHSVKALNTNQVNMYLDKPTNCIVIKPSKVNGVKVSKTGHCCSVGLFNVVKQELQESPTGIRIYGKAIGNAVYLSLSDISAVPTKTKKVKSRCSTFHSRFITKNQIVSLSVKALNEKSARKKIIATHGEDTNILFVKARRKK